MGIDNDVNVDTKKASHSPAGDRTVFVGRFDKITNGVLPQVDIQYQPTSTVGVKIRSTVRYCIHGL